MSPQSRKPAPLRFTITPAAAPPFVLVLSGRLAWALDRLRAAGRTGCTPITEPAPRWSAYVHALRALDVPIETITEVHGGPYSGHHARYVLRAVVTVDGGA